MKRDLETKLYEARCCLELQGQSGNWDYDNYMHGLYNGMEMIMSTMEERGAEFRDSPERFRCYSLSDSLSDSLKEKE